MGYKWKFTTPSQNAMEHFSGISGVRCKTCNRYTTNAQLSYSMRFYGMPLCRTCQSLEHYKRGLFKEQKEGEGNGDN